MSVECLSFLLLLISSSEALIYVLKENFVGLCQFAFFYVFRELKPTKVNVKILAYGSHQRDVLC